MLSPSEALARARRSLRWFGYTRPVGGHGGDFDTLIAVARCADAAQVGALLGTLGLAAPPSPLPPVLSLGGVLLGGEQVQLTVCRAAGGGFEVQLLAAVYVGEEELARAARLEAWLEARGVRLEPAVHG